MRATNADDLYEMAKELPVRERLRLVERIAHDLALPTDITAEGSAALAGRLASVSLLGYVKDFSFEPLRFTIKTDHNTVTFRAARHLVEAARNALGREVLVEADESVDSDGAILDATALRVSAEAEDLLDMFDATFGTGREAMSTPEGEHFIETMRGGGA